MQAKDYEALYIHGRKSISKENIIDTSQRYGFSHRDIVESHIWVYELHAQIQRYAKEHCVLKGGACTQLYLPINVQRCTVDIDACTDLSASELEEIMFSIRYKFNVGKFYCSFKEYVPTFIGKTQRLPMKTFLFFLPFIYKKGRKKEPPWIKVDFLFLDTKTMPTNIITKAETIGLKLNYSPICISPYSMISDKLLTFAVNSIGLDTYKIDSFYKNIYDLFYLINRYNDLESFKKISFELRHSIDIEFLIKNIKPHDTIEILDDVMQMLFNIFTFDLRNDPQKPHKKLIRFEESFIQGSIKEKLNADTWALMAMYNYLFTLSLKQYTETGSYDKLNFVEHIINIYEYMNSLSPAIKNQYIKKLKSEIILEHPELSLGIIEEPLRLIYIHYILTK